MDPRTFAASIDHTLLIPDATAEMIRRLCAEARRFHFAAVCVNPYWVRFASEEMEGADVAIATVAGFPLGASQTEAKVFESVHAIEAGAREIDMVMNVGEIVGGDAQAVEEDIRAVVTAAHERGALVKVILETGLLNERQKRLACECARIAGADFVKTSTGFGPGGATVEDVRLMRAEVGMAMGVKASGGIRTWEDCRAMMAAGANRIGTSAGVAILESITG